MKLHILKNNDYIASAFSKALTIFLGVFTSVFFNRYMGLEVKGQYAYIINFVSVGALVLNFGVYESYAKNYRKSIPNLSQKYINIFATQFLMYLLFALVGFNFFNDRGYAIGILMVPLEVLVLQMNNVMLIEDIKFRYKINNLKSLLFLTLSFILFVAMPRSLMYVILMIIVLNVTVIISYIIKLRKWPNPFKLDVSFMWECLKFGVLPMLSGLLIIMNYRVDVFFLREFVSISDVGLYTTGVSLAGYAWLIPDIFKDVLFSRTARSDSVGTVKLSIKLSLYSLFLTILLIIVFGKQLLFIMFGSEFVPAYSITVLLFFGVPSMMFYKIIGTLYMAQGRKNFYFLTLLISVIANIILNVILIPKHGINGAAFASIVSYSVCGLTFLFNFLFKYKIKISEILILTRQEINIIMTSSGLKKRGDNLSI